LVFEISCVALKSITRAGRTYNCAEEVMIREEFHVGDFDVFLQTVYLQTGLVIYVHVLFLRDGEEGFIV
jgi:hypothetical protein